MNAPTQRHRTFELRAMPSTAGDSLEASLASDQPVFRAELGANEVLSFAPGAVNLERARDGLPLLFGHDGTALIGRAHDVRVDGNRLRARLSFFDSAAGRDARAVVDGGHREVSIGYLVDDYQVDKAGAYRVTRWRPYEASIVAIPADHTVGIQRSFESTAMNENTTSATVHSDDSETRLSRSQRRALADTQAQEDDRVQNILALAKTVPGGERLAVHALERGHTMEQFQRDCLQSMSTKPIPTADVGGPYIQTNRHSGQYSLGRAIQSMVDPAGYSRSAGFEREMSQELERNSVRSTQGMRVPASAIFGSMNRSLLTTGSAGNTVQTSVLGDSLVEVLRASSVVAKLGSTVMSGLQGNVSIPRQTAGASVSWVAENSAPAASDPTFDSITMTPKTLGALVDVSRRVKIQSSVDIEAVVKADLAEALLAEIDRAALFGSGTSNQPRGISNTVGINTVVGGANGAAVTWLHVLEMERRVAELNAIRDAQRAGYAINFATRAKFKSTPKLAGGLTDPVMGDMPADNAGLYSLNSYRSAVSSRLPSNGTKGTGTNLSTLIFADWSQLFMAAWGEIDLMVDPYSLSSSGGIRLIGLVDLDVAVRHPESFCVMTDAITA